MSWSTASSKQEPRSRTKSAAVGAVRGHRPPPVLAVAYDTATVQSGNARTSALPNAYAIASLVAVEILQTEADDSNVADCVIGRSHLCVGRKGGRQTGCLAWVCRSLAARRMSYRRRQPYPQRSRSFDRVCSDPGQ